MTLHFEVFDEDVEEALALLADAALPLDGAGRALRQGAARGDRRDPRPPGGSRATWCTSSAWGRFFGEPLGHPICGTIASVRAHDAGRPCGGSSRASSCPANMVVALVGGASAGAHPARPRAARSRTRRRARRRPGRASPRGRASGTLRLRRQDLAQTYLVRLDGRPARRAQRARAVARARDRRRRSRRAALPGGPRAPRAGLRRRARRSSTAATGPWRSSPPARRASTRRGCATPSSAPAATRPRASPPTSWRARARRSATASPASPTRVSTARWRTPRAPSAEPAVARRDRARPRLARAARTSNRAWRRALDAPTLTACSRADARCGARLRLRARAASAGRGGRAALAARAVRADRAAPRGRSSCRRSGCDGSAARRSTSSAWWPTATAPRSRSPSRSTSEPGKGGFAMAGGSEPTTDDRPGVLDPDDLLVFMACDAGERAPGGAPPAAARPRDPHRRPARPHATGWAYVVVAEHPPRTDRRYVDYDAARRPRARRALPRRHGGRAADLLRRRATAARWGRTCSTGSACAPRRRCAPGLAHWTITERDGSHELIAWTAGPVRVVRRSRHKVDIGHRHPSSPPGIAHTYFYGEHVYGPGSMKLPISPRIFFSDITAMGGVDLQRLDGWRYVAPGAPAPGFAIDGAHGRRASARFDGQRDLVRADRRPARRILVAITMSENLREAIPLSLVYLDDAARRAPPEVIAGQRPAGRHPRAGRAEAAGGPLRLPAPRLRPARLPARRRSAELQQLARRVTADVTVPADLAAAPAPAR